MSIKRTRKTVPNVIQSASTPVRVRAPTIAQNALTLRMENTALLIALNPNMTSKESVCPVMRHAWDVLDQIIQSANMVASLAIRLLLMETKSSVV